MNNTIRLGISGLQRKEIQERYRRNGALTLRKLREFIPVMILTNLSTLLLVSVDGIVVGNFIGPDALSSVNVFYPAIVFIGVISMLVSSGISASLSLCMGRHDQGKLLKVKLASKRLIIIAAIFISAIQVPAVILLINSYHLSPEMYQLTWQYAIGIMIASPFGLVSTVGVYQLQIVGKMKVLMALTMTEGGVNLLLDLLFVGAFKMGVAGAGYGTMAAGILRCLLTILYISRNTDIYHSAGATAGFREIREILSAGLPEAANSLMLALQNYFIMQIILSMLGEEGGAIKGVCTFALSTALVLINGIQNSMRPLTGLMCGSNDWEGLRILLLQCVELNFILVGILTLVCEVFPGLFYLINGVKVIPEHGLFMLRLCALHFIFKGLNALFRLYFTYRGDSTFTTILTVTGNATLPLFAFALSHIISGPWLWGAYLLTELVLLISYLTRYLMKIKADRKEMKEDIGLFYLSLKPSEAVEASRAIRAYADDNGFDKNYSYRIALCTEEMAAYAEKSQKRSDLNLQIMIRFREDGAMFMMLDDGKCIALDNDKELQRLITDNYGLLRKLARSVEYQYVLNMNYSVFTF